MKSSTYWILAALVGAATLMGCSNLSPLARKQASSQIELKQDTAIVIRHNVAPEQVTISEVQIPPICTDCSIHWHAAAPTGEFECSGLIRTIDDSSVGVEKTVCVKK